MAAHFHGSIAPCAQAQSLLPDQPPQDGPILLHSPAAVTDHSPTAATELMTYGFISYRASLPEDPGANGNSTSKQRRAPYESQRLLAPNFDDDDDTGDVSTGNELTVNGVRMDAVERIYEHRPIRKRPRGDDLSLEPGQDKPEHYHWRGLLAQSLFFNAIENCFRIASDDQIRYLLATKPFWHDYFASMKQFNMRRWNDGDEFLVNYVGHSMQGSISSYIAIQNDPVGREQEISATRAYWVSRFKGFLWATVYSTHSEISPLGEAGIGNEGGWTYPINANCHRPCPTFKPGVNKYTNNTGWVDFIITPTVGSLWVLAEDTLDRYVSDRIQGEDRSRIFPKIIRGTLNPSRTMSNFVRFKKPWYRDFQGDETSWRPSRGIHMLPSDEERARNQQLQRFSFSAHYRTAPVGSAAHRCVLCNEGRGRGLEADYAITPWISASVSLDNQQGLLERGASTDGSTLSAGFGVRLVHERPYNTFSLSLRPGLVVEQIPVPAHVDTAHGTYVARNQLNIVHPAATILLANDYKLNRMVALRSAFGATIVRYRTSPRDPSYIGKVPYLSWLSTDSYTNRTTWIWQGGPVFRF
ncbi:MAG TPA: hypothetical protein VIX42_07460 [Edaphobacter sp.]